MGTEREGWRIEPYNFERKTEESKVLRLLVKKKKKMLRKCKVIFFVQAESPETGES